MGGDEEAFDGASGGEEVLGMERRRWRVEEEKRGERRRFVYIVGCLAVLGMRPDYANQNTPTISIPRHNSPHIAIVPRV